MTVAEFMALANAEYYAARDPFGRAGDFVTAPEISQVFGELLGLWCVQVWRDQNRPSPKRLVELGPGRGTLMADALRAAKLAPEFLDALDVVLVEASPLLRAKQEELLKGEKVQWQERFDSVPNDRPLLLLANEFFDALPIRQFVKTARGWCERMVTRAGDKLAFALAPVPVADALIPVDRADAPDGAVYEMCQPALAIVGEIARGVAAQGGGALIVDYGYDAPAFGETLQAVRGHAFASVLDNPGDRDLSAHVDFAALAAAAEAEGASVYGPVSQAAFLEALGIAQRFEQLASHNRATASTLWAQLDRLVNAKQMGTLFKALAILPKVAPRPPGF
ncbi:MAG: SAM-dependent methyltransferase [Alphaproteobacteria bacterium]|nr:SAM-dependent methyltransferase [Alphaproteobacteria bacterium]